MVLEKTHQEYATYFIRSYPTFNHNSGLGTAELRRLRQFEEENAQLKRMVADLTLDKQMLR